MEIYENVLMLAALLVQNSFYRLKWAIERRKKGSSLQIDQEKLFACSTDCRIASSGSSAGKVSRTDHPRLIIDKIKNLTVIPGMIPHGNPVNAQFEQLLDNLPVDASAMGSILPIGNDDIWPIFGFEPREHIPDCLAAYCSYDIADK